MLFRSQQRLWLEQQELAACNADAATGVDRGAVLLIELKALDPRQRRVVQAVVLEGCSLRDVAARMGSSAATAAPMPREAPVTSMTGC